MTDPNTLAAVTAIALTAALPATVLCQLIATLCGRSKIGTPAAVRQLVWAAWASLAGVGLLIVIVLKSLAYNLS